MVLFGVLTPYVWCHMVLNGVKWCRIGNCIHYVALFQEVLYVEMIHVYNIQNEMCYLLSSASLIIKF